MDGKFKSKMSENLVNEVKKKREFSQLPDSVVERALQMSEGEVKEARSVLRKYFGVFLTNKVVKPKVLGEGVLENHLSSKKRDYDFLYEKLRRVLSEDFFGVVDLGCGVNGFSYNLLRKYFGGVNYLGVEASGQLVDLQNKYFCKKGFENARVLRGDLFDLDLLRDVLKKIKKKKIVFAFQLVDAFEFFERDFSKKFFLALKENLNEGDKVVLSISRRGLSGSLKKASGNWVVDFLKEEFEFLGDFEVFDERFVCFEN